MLKQNYQRKIAQKFGVDNANVMTNWLNEINILRNYSAHHARVWNKKYNNPIKLLQNGYFIQFQFNDDNKKRLFVRMVVIWYLISQFTNSYDWNEKIIDLMKNKFPTVPNAKLKSMGIAQHHLDLFLLSPKNNI